MSITKEKANEDMIKYIDEMKDIYSHLLSFIDNPDSNVEEDYHNLIKINDKYDIQRNKEIFQQSLSPIRFF